MLLNISDNRCGNEQGYDKRKIISAFGEIFEQHCQETILLWELRFSSSRWRHQHAALQKLECRLSANISGLAISPDDAWTFASEAFDLMPGPGEMFVLALLAFKAASTAPINVARGDHRDNHETENSPPGSDLADQKVQQVLQLCADHPEAFNGLISALASLPANIVHPQLSALLKSPSLFHQYLVVTVCSLRRDNLGDYLKHFLSQPKCIEHKELFARSLRIAGELKRYDMIPLLEQHAESLQAKDEAFSAAAFWANWSLTLLGHPLALERLKIYIAQENVHQDRAINLAFRVLPKHQGHAWIKELIVSGAHTDIIIRATAAMGYMETIPWLIAQMATPELAPLAGRGFTQISGVDIEEGDLVIAADELGDMAEGDISNEIQLPHPDYQKVRAYWQQQAKPYPPEQRYLLGRPITEQHLQTLMTGQSIYYREAAAIEYALLAKQNPYPNPERVESL